MAPVIGGVAGGLIDKTSAAGSGIYHKKHGKKLYEIGMVDVFGKSGSLKNRSGPQGPIGLRHSNVSLIILLARFVFCLFFELNLYYFIIIFPF